MYTNLIRQNVNSDAHTVCMYVYSRGGPQTALAPRPSLIYCASPIINPLLVPHLCSYCTPRPTET
jgi:hypothetical protein